MLRKVSSKISEYNEYKLFSSHSEYKESLDSFIGVRLASLIISEEDKSKRINHYSDNEVIHSAAQNATVLWNGHLGIVSPVNRLSIASKVDPEEYVFFRCRAIDAGGYAKDGNTEGLHGANDNGDYFSAEELLKETTLEFEKKAPAFATFVGKMFFTDHANDKVEDGKGMIINAYYDLEENCVYCDVMLDAKKEPKLARLISQGIAKDVSMGCAVEWSECSICGNKAANVHEYCDHVRNFKNKTISGKRVYEINHDLKFIEISSVTDGAFKNCMVEEIMSYDDMISGIQEMQDSVRSPLYMKSSLQQRDHGLRVLSSSISYAKKRYLDIKNSLNGRQLLVTGSIEELTKLSDSLDLIRDVCKTMIEMDNVDYEFVKDLSSVLDSLQKVILDLASAGFNEDKAGGQALVDRQKNPGGGNGAEQPSMGQPQSPAAEEQSITSIPGNNPAAAPSSVSVPEREEFPLAAKNNITNKLISISHKILGIRNDCLNILTTSTVNNMNVKVSTSIDHDEEKNITRTVVSLGDYTMSYIQGDKIGEAVNTFYKKKIIQSKPLGKFPKVTAALIRSNPVNVLASRLQIFKDQMGRLSQGDTMKYQERIQKTSATDQVLEGQLGDLGGNFERSNEIHAVDGPILQGRLDEIDAGPYTGEPEYLLEGTVQKGSERSNQRVNPDHKVDRGTGEAQLADKNRRVEDDRAGINYGTGEDQFESRSKEYTTHRSESDRATTRLPIGEGQMDDAKSGSGNKRLDVCLMSITEEQMKSKRDSDELAGESGQTKWSKIVSDNIIEALASTVIENRVTPNDVVESCKDIVANADISKLLISASAKETLKAYAAADKLEGTDLSEAVAMKISVINSEDGLTSNNKTELNQFKDILAGYLKGFLKNQEKFAKAVANRANDKLSALSEVVSGKKTAAKIEEKELEFFSNMLNEYVDEPSEDRGEFEFVCSAKEFNGLTLADGDKYYNRAHKIALQTIADNILDKKADLSSLDIEIISISDAANAQVVNGIVSVSSSVLDLLEEYDIETTANDDEDEDDIKVDEDEDEGLEDTESSYDDDDDDKEEEEDEDEEKEASINNVPFQVAAMRQALKNVFAQTPPVGMPGDPNAMNAPAGPGAGGGAPGLGAMSNPPADDFNPVDTAGDEGPDMGGDDSEVGTPKFAGSRCPVCGDAHDLETIDDYIKCGTCGTEFSVKIAYEVLDSPIIRGEESASTDEGDIEEVEDVSEGEDIGNELNAVPTAGGAPGGAPTMAPTGPVGASFKVHPKALVMTGTQYYGNGIKAKVGDIVAVGHRCPSCGSTHTYVDNSAFKCVTCGTKGKFSVTASKDNSMLAEVKLSWISSPRVNPVKGNDAIFEGYSNKIATASATMQSRINQNPKTMEDCVAGINRELREDGYSVNDAKVIAELIRKSVLNELATEDKSESKEEEKMANTDSKLLSSQEEQDLNALLADNDEELESEAMKGDSKTKSCPGNKIKPTPAGSKAKDKHSLESEAMGEMYSDEDISEDDGGSELETVDLLVDDAGEGEDFGAEDEGFGEDFGDETEGFGEGAADVTIEVSTPGNDEVVIEISDGQATVLDEDPDAEFEDEEPDYLGEESEEGAEDENFDLGDEYEDDFSGEGEDEDDEGFETESDESDSDVNEDDMNFIDQAMLMNDKGVISRSGSFAKTIDIDKVAAMLNLDMNKVRAQCKPSTAQELLKESKINFGDTQEVRRYLSKTSQVAQKDQTQPLSVEDAVGKGEGVGDAVPRKPEVGLKQTEPKSVVEVKTDKYKRGKGGNVGGETAVVPRSPGNSGMKGQGATDFAEEKGDNVTSGNPDSYTQTYQEVIKPTPKSSEENRVRASLNAKIESYAKSRGASIKDVSVKKLNDLYIVAHKGDVKTIGKLSKVLSKSYTIDFPEVEVFVSKEGVVKKKAKVQKSTKKYATARSGEEAISKVRSMSKYAQNVPEKSLEYIDADDEYIVLDTRSNKSWSIRKKAS